MLDTIIIGLLILLALVYGFWQYYVEPNDAREKKKSKFDQLFFSFFHFIKKVYEEKNAQMRHVCSMMEIITSGIFFLPSSHSASDASNESFFWLNSFASYKQYNALSRVSRCSSLYSALHWNEWRSRKKNFLQRKNELDSMSHVKIMIKNSFFSLFVLKWWNIIRKFPLI